MLRGLESLDDHRGFLLVFFGTAEWRWSEVFCEAPHMTIKFEPACTSHLESADGPQ